MSCGRTTMNSCSREGVNINIQAKRPADAETVNEQFFTQQLLASFPTNNTCLRKSKKAKNREAPKNKNDTINHCHGESEKSPRQAKRNARERGRKARLNAAFQVLRSIIPRTVESSHERKLTQVEILRLAKNYICSLTSMLQACDEDTRASYQDGDSSSDNIFQAQSDLETS